MNRIVNFLQKYFAVISILIGISIVLSMTFSNYIVSSNSHKAAEMYIGELKYSVEIDGSLNMLTVPNGETVVDVRVSNLNPVDTYYKLLYLKNSNITIKYYESTKDTDEVVTTYSKPNDSIKGDNSNYIKLIITNSSTTTQNVALAMKGGYITNTVDDIIVPSTYSDITEIESTKTNTYFCKTDASLEQGLKYVNGQFTYAYKQQGASSTSGLGWTNINSNGWGVQLTDKTSTDAVTSKFCTYINNKPTTSTVMMFYNSKTDSIDLTKFDTSKITNMASMFYGVQTSVLDVSNFDTSSVTNMYCMFYKTIATTLDVSNFDTSKVYNMRSMFGESKVTTLDLSNFDTSKVINMKSMFYKSNVTTLDVSNFNTSKVTDMSYMFHSVQATILDVSNFDTSNVTDMSFMFYRASATTLDVSNFDTSNVITMSSMFNYAEATEIDVSGFDTSKVTNMSYIFSGCKTTVLDVSNFDTSNVTNMRSMFWSVLAPTIDVSKFNTSNVTDMSFMFYKTVATTLDVSGFDTSKVTDMSAMFYNSMATTLDVTDFDTSNVTNMSTMFYSSKATTLDVSKFNTSNVTDMSHMFYNTLPSIINLSNFDTSNVTKMRSMFAYSSATKLDLSSFVTSKVTDMSYMFTHAKATTLDISSFDTSNVTDMSYMFQTFDVDTLDLTNFNTSNVTNMKYMFAGNNATKINVNSFDTSNVTDMSLMFASSKATILDVGNFDTSKVTNMGSMFSNTQVVSLDLSGFNTSNVTDMSWMFSNYKGTKLDVSSFNTSNVTNMKYMFGNSSNLETIYTSDKFVTTNVNNSDYMFINDTNLVGGSGTKYSSAYVDKTFARIDSGTNNPGYFTGKPSTFNTDSWATIVSSVKAGNTRGYKVGDIKTIDLGTTYGTHTLRIANTSTPNECSTEGFSQTACGFVLEFTDIITTHVMNDNLTNVGGWPSSSMYTFINTSIYNTLPMDLKSGIINTIVVSGYGTSDSNNFTSIDKLYLLAPKEIYTNFYSSFDTSKKFTRTLDYYIAQGVTTSNYGGAIKKNGTSDSSWWLRTAISTSGNSFFAIDSNGNWSYTDVLYEYGVSPAFRIG